MNLFLLALFSKYSKKYVPRMQMTFDHSFANIKSEAAVSSFLLHHCPGKYRKCPNKIPMT